MKLKPITDKAIETIIGELLESQNFQSSTAESATRMMLTRKIRSTVNEARVMLHIKQHIRSELKGEFASETELNIAVDKLIDQSLHAKSLAFNEDTVFHLKQIAEALGKN
ncbi:TPA: hypothetical protein R4216_000424 [Citrobacter freundii]|nr:hypothetical protein [Citrobacter freundii]HED3835972.1 hypothetical protein [Citrobacter freundii]HED3841406.1 hypothetical protein [Citrobacter freundii]